jgi:asparagine synthase (glutamine-hydrolysing)
VCGIVGVYEYARTAGGVSDPLVEAMRDTLRHRGPDGAGSYISPDRRVGLGHRRLAIVDPRGGTQPMFGLHDECLVFNGEIYNYPALRRTLERDGTRFRTSCDTEVILHLYSRYGEACVDHLNGMFAFALWDGRRGRLLLARDRVGEKPLYWADVDGVLVFGSEIKALLAHPLVDRSVNESAIPSYFTHLVVPSPHTLFGGINKLPPATLAVCDRGGIRSRRFWDPFQPRSWAPLPLAEAAVQVRRRLRDSIHARMMSDVPVGVLLSGGLDSTTLVALLRERARSLATFSVGFTGASRLDERAEARAVAEHYGTQHHEIQISERDALGFLPSLVHHQDEPLADPVCVPLHFVCGLARGHGVKVVLAGEGSDELFWGYPRYKAVLGRWRTLRTLLALPRLLRSVLPEVVPTTSRRPIQLRELLEQVRAGRLSPIHLPLGLTTYERTQLLRRPEDRFPWLPSDHGIRGSGDPLTELAFDTQEHEIGLRLPELLLMRIDRFSMANGVEARVPFLDPELVEFVYRLPLELKLQRGVGKIVLRNAVADIVPEAVLNRPKQGFGAPILDWFQHKMGDLLASLLAGEAIRRYFDENAVRKLLAQHARGARNEPVLWPVLNFALWHRYWIEQERLEPLLEPLVEIAD